VEVSFGEIIAEKVSLAEIIVEYVPFEESA